MLNYHRVSATLTQPSVLQHLQLVHAVLQQMGELRVPVRHMRNSLLLLLDHTWYARLVNSVHSNLWTLRHFNGKNVQKKLQNGLTTWLIDSRQSAAGLSDFFCTHMCYSVVVPPYLLSTNTFGGWEVVTQLALCLGLGHHYIGQSAQGSVDVLSLSESIARCLTRRRKASVSSRGQMQHLFENYHGDGDLYLYIIIHLSCWFDLLVSGVYRQISVIFRLFSFNIIYK